MALRAFADGTVFGEVVGNGPPDVLAMHGWGRRGADFTKVLEGFNAIAVDLPGFGASPSPAAPLGASGYAEIVMPLLDEFEHPPVLIGHSFGGRVAVCLAARPDVSVRALVLTGVPLVRSTNNTSPKVGYRLVRYLNQIGLISDERLEAEKRKRGSADYRAATGVMRDILVTVVNESYEEEMRRLEAPVVMIWGSDDSEVPVSVAETSLEIINEAGGSATLEVVEGVGHHTPLQAPDSLRAALREAIRQ